MTQPEPMYIRLQNGDIGQHEIYGYPLSRALEIAVGEAADIERYGGHVLSVTVWSEEAITDKDRGWHVRIVTWEPEA